MLGELERAIMEVAWSRQFVTVRDVVEALRRSPAPAYTTVMTVMNRLVEKGMLRRRADGQSFRYAAAQSKEHFLQQSSRRVVETFVRHYGHVAITQFIDALDDVDPQRLAALRRKFRHGS